MLVDQLKQRLGFLLVVAGAGLGVALITGSELVASAVAVVAGFGVLTVMARRKDSRSPQGDGSTRQKGAPISYSFAWELAGVPSLEPTVKLLGELGLRKEGVSASSDDLTFRGGSQLHTRLWGGYFVAPNRLPIQVKIVPVVAEDLPVRVELEIQDTLKVAIRDGALEDRYGKAASDIRGAVEEGLKDWRPTPADIKDS